MLRFERSGKPDVLRYHFSCHPVCYTDDKSGPDWLGLKAEEYSAVVVPKIFGLPPFKPEAAQTLADQANLLLKLTA